MAKKKVSTPRSTSRKKGSSTASPPAGNDCSAAEAGVDFAREQLRKAEAYYEEMKAKAEDQAQQLRETTLGDLVDGVLDFVKKHPGTGVVGAAMLGFVLGRLTRR